MTQLSEKKQAIVTNLKEKPVLKQKVYNRTLEAFCSMKEILRSFAREGNVRFGSIDPRIRLEFTDRSKFDAQIEIAGDMLFFNMHSNIFQFNSDDVLITEAHSK